LNKDLDWNDGENYEDICEENEVENNILNETITPTWGPVIGYLNNIQYNPDNLEVCINSDIMETMLDCLPIDFYSLCFDEEILDILIKETLQPRNLFITVD